MKVTKQLCTYDWEGYPDDRKELCTYDWEGYPDDREECGKICEDIGLTPEEIRELKECDQEILSVMFDPDNYIIEEVGEENMGRCLYYEPVEE